MAYDLTKRQESGALDVGGGLGGTSGVSKRTDRKCTLVLEDGSVYSGQSFGSEVGNPFRPCDSHSAQPTSRSALVEHMSTRKGGCRPLVNDLRRRNEP